MAASDIAVVDAANRFVRWASRAEVHGSRLAHRSVHVLVVTPGGDWVVQRRRHDKLTWPDHWDVSAAGHVERSDYAAGPDEGIEAVYDAVAAREVAEELGVVAPLERLGAWAPVEGVFYEHLRLYRAVHPGPFRPQPEEVAELRVVPVGELARLTPQTTALRWWAARFA